MRLRPSHALPWLLLLYCAQAQEPEQWTTEFSSGIFMIHCDFPLNDESSLLSELNSVRADLRELLNVVPKQSKIHIVLFGTESEYRRYMAKYFVGLPERRAMFIQHRGPGMLFTFVHPELDTDLRHEVTHAIVNRRNHALPLWLDEGLAEYFEVLRAERFAGNPGVPAVAKLARQGRLRSIAELASIEQLSEFSDAHYRDAWAWVHFLIHRKSETRELLTRYLRESPPVVRIGHSTGFDLQWCSSGPRRRKPNATYFRIFLNRRPDNKGFGMELARAFLADF
jgi:hypothetical protein